MPINVIPLSDRVILSPIHVKDITDTGLFIPDTAREKPTKGIVVAVGAGTKDVEMHVKEGDVVIYGKYAGTTVEIEGAEYVMIKHNDILAIIIT